MRVSVVSFIVLLMVLVITEAYRCSVLPFINTFLMQAANVGFMVLRNCFFNS